MATTVWRGEGGWEGRGGEGGGGQGAGYGGVAGCRGVGRNGGALEVAVARRKGVGRGWLVGDALRELPAAGVT